MSERIIKTGQYNAHGAETRSAYTPSEEFGGTTNTEEFHDEHLQINNPEAAEVAAYAAKPFMDVAAAIYENNQVATERENGATLDAGDKVSIMNQSGLKELVALGERRAHKAEQAANMGSFQPRVITESETQFLDAMKVVADHAKAQATTDVDAFYADNNPRVAEELVASTGDVFSVGRKNMLASKLMHLKDDTELYNEESHLLDTSDYVLEDAGKAALTNQVLSGSEKMKLTNRLQALKGHTTVLELIAQKYNYENATEHSAGNELEATPTRNENIAKDALEAREMLTHSPDLMKQLIDETEAFKDYSIKNNTKADIAEWLERQGRIFNDEVILFKEVLNDWASNSPSESLEDYIENAQDTATDKSEQVMLASYVQIKNNYFFTDRQTAILKRMNAARVSDGSTTGSQGFEATYF